MAHPADPLGPHDPEARWTREVYEQVKAEREQGKTWTVLASDMGVPRATLRDAFARMEKRYGADAPPAEPVPEAGRIFHENTATGEATLRLNTDEPVKTLADLLRLAEVDGAIWQVHTWECRAWTTPLNVKRGQKVASLQKCHHCGEEMKPHSEEVLQWRKDRPQQQQQWLVSAKLQRKKPDVMSMEAILHEIAAGPVALPVYRLPRPRRGVRRALEVSIMDPHLGLRCFQPQADQSWSLEEAEQAFMATVEKLLALAEPYGPFAEIVAPIGNDFLHADNLAHTTTGGTAQPEMESIQEVFGHAQRLILWFSERLRQLATVKLLSIPGNHDRLMAFTLARLVEAFYQGAKCKTVNVDASASPYKFWSYGVNLIGFEHGHSIPPIRLAALMANETRKTHWRDARHCEWHLGDQHRKGSSKPSVLEEQGVSVEYLPSLTPPNEWHRLKAFNWQKRGAMAFVYDHDAGPLARLQVSFDSYTGKHLGAQ